MLYGNIIQILLEIKFRKGLEAITNLAKNK
jgi:hypothetical protein